MDRIVNMKFNNQEFKQGVDKSKRDLTGLESALTKAGRNNSEEIHMDSKDRAFFVNSNGTHGFFGGQKDSYCGLHGCHGTSPDCELKKEED